MYDEYRKRSYCCNLNDFIYSLHVSNQVQKLNKVKDTFAKNFDIFALLLHKNYEYILIHQSKTS